MTAVVTDMIKPNGLAFSPDESLLYVADTGITHDPSVAPGDPRVPGARRTARASAEGHVFATCDAGLFDGFRVDIQRQYLDLHRRRRATAITRTAR